MTEEEFGKASTRLLELEHEISQLPLVEIYKTAVLEGKGSVNNIFVISEIAWAAGEFKQQAQIARKGPTDNRLPLAVVKVLQNEC